MSSLGETLNQHLSQHPVDAPIGLAAVTAPLWLNWFEGWMQALLLVGGVVLLMIRIAIAWREWRGHPHGHAAKHFQKFDDDMDA